VHFVPVGHTKETLLESLRHYPLSRVILLLGDNPKLEPEQKARTIAKQLKDDLGSIPSEEFYVDTDDIPKAALAIAERMKQEKEAGNEVMVNLSGSLRSIGLAAYMAALAVQVKAYIGLPKYEGDKITGVRQVINAPLFPLKPLSSEKVKILRIIRKAEQKMEDLILKTNPKLKKSSQDYLNERSRLSHHLKDLKEDGFIETEKKGKNITIRLTPLGKIYMEGLGK